MQDHKSEILIAIKNLVEAREIIFSHIVNLAMSGEMSHIGNTFKIGEGYDFILSHFEDLEDENIKILVSLCKKTEKSIYSLMTLNGINENEIQF